MIATQKPGGSNAERGEYLQRTVHDGVPFHRGDDAQGDAKQRDDEYGWDGELQSGRDDFNEHIQGGTSRHP